MLRRRTGSRGDRNEPVEGLDFFTHRTRDRQNDSSDRDKPVQRKSDSHSRIQKLMESSQKRKPPEKNVPIHQRNPVFVDSQTSAFKISSQPSNEAKSFIADFSPSFAIPENVEKKPTLEIKENSVTLLDDVTTHPDNMNLYESFQSDKIQERKEALQEIDAHIQDHIKNLLEDVSNIFITDSGLGVDSEVKTTDKIQHSDNLPVEIPEVSTSSIINETEDLYIPPENSKIETVDQDSPSDIMVDEKIPMSNLYQTQFVPEAKRVEEDSSNVQGPSIIKDTTSDVHEIFQPFVTLNNMSENVSLTETSLQKALSDAIPDTANFSSEFINYPLNYHENVVHEEIPHDSYYPTSDSVYQQFYSSQPYYAEYFDDQNSQYHSEIPYPVYLEPTNIDPVSASFKSNSNSIDMQTQESIGKVTLDESCHDRQIINPTELNQETSPVGIEPLISVPDQQDQNLIVPPDSKIPQYEFLKSGDLEDKIDDGIIDPINREEKVVNRSSSYDNLYVNRPEQEPEMKIVEIEKNQKTQPVENENKCESDPISSKSIESVQKNVSDLQESHLENKDFQKSNPSFDSASRKTRKVLKHHKHFGSPETIYVSSLRMNSESRKSKCITSSSYNGDLQSLDTIPNAVHPPNTDFTASVMYSTWLAQYGQWMENYKNWCQSTQYNTNSIKKINVSPVCKCKLSTSNRHSTVIDNQLSSISDYQHSMFSDVIDRNQIYEESIASTANRKTSAAEREELRKIVENTVRDLSDRLTYPLLHTIRCHANFGALSKWLIVSSHQKKPLGHYQDTKSLKLINASFLHRQSYEHPEYSDFDFEHSNTLEISQLHPLCGLCESEFHQLADVIDNIVIPSIGNSKMLPIWMFFSVLIRFSIENCVNKSNSIDSFGDILNSMFRRISTIFLNLPKFEHAVDTSRKDEELENITEPTTLASNDFNFPLSSDGQGHLSQKNVIDYFKGQHNWQAALAISMCFPKFVPETIDDFLDTLPYNSSLTSLIHFRLQRPIPILRNIDYQEEENTNGRLNYFRRSWKDHVGIVLALADTPIGQNLPNDINLSIDGLLYLSGSILLYCSRRLGYNDCLLIQSHLCFLTSNRKLEPLEPSMTNYKGYLAFYPSLHLIGVDPWIYSCCHNSIDRSLFGYDTLSLDILCSLPLHVLLLTNLWHTIYHSSMYFRNFHLHPTELGDPDSVFYIHYIRFALAIKYVDIGMAKQALELIECISISVVKFSKNFKRRFIFLLQKVGYEIFYASNPPNHPIHGITIPSWLLSLVENWKTWPNLRTVSSSNDHQMHQIPHDGNVSGHEPVYCQSSISAPILHTVNNVPSTEYSAPAPPSMNNTINSHETLYPYQNSASSEMNLFPLSNSHLTDSDSLGIHETQSQQFTSFDKSIEYPTHPVSSELSMPHVPFQKTQYSTQRTSTFSDSRDNLAASFEIPRNLNQSVVNSLEEVSPPSSFQNSSQNHPPNTSLPHNNNNNNHYFNVSSSLYSSQGEVTSSFLNQIYPDTSECIFSKFPSSVNESEKRPFMSSESNRSNVSDAQPTPNSLSTSQSVTAKIDSMNDENRNISSQPSQESRESSSVLGSLFGLVKNLKLPKRKRGFDILKDELVPNSEDTIAPKSDLSEDLKAPPLSPIDPSMMNNDPTMSMSATSLSSDLDAKSNSPGSSFPVSRRANRYIKPSY